MKIKLSTLIKTKSIGLFGLLFIIGCANIIPPTGGEKDKKSPEIESVYLEKSGAGGVNKITFEFDERIVINSWDKYFYTSPHIKKITQKVRGKSLLLEIEDTIQKNTKYTISLSNCVKDLTEGNISDSLTYSFSLEPSKDTLVLDGRLIDSYSLKPIQNAWVLLYDYNIHDSLILKTEPNYISKTNLEGKFFFNNLSGLNQKIAAISGEKMIYSKTEKIAFDLNPNLDSVNEFILLYGFNESCTPDTSVILSDSLKTNQKKGGFGKIKINSNEFFSSVIFQFLQEEKIISEFCFETPPYNIKNVAPGEYTLRCIEDQNNNKLWDCGNWENKTNAEKVTEHAEKIIIRTNWDLEIDWKNQFFR